MTTDLATYDTDTLLEELTARAGTELAKLTENLEACTRDLDEARQQLKERQRFYKALGFAATEAEPDGEHPCKHAGCDRTFPTVRGAKAHHTREHTRKPTAAVSTAPIPDPSGILKCSCGDRFNVVADLDRHCSLVHGRRPYADERTPR